MTRGQAKRKRTPAEPCQTDRQDEDPDAEAESRPEGTANEPRQHEDPLDNPEIYECKKRLPMRKAAGKRDVHVSRKANFRALVARIIKLLGDSKLPVTLHAMGAAITRCCDLALRVQADVGGHVSLHVLTGTVIVYDDYEPLVEGYPEVTKTRRKSSIEITLTPTEQYV